MIVAMGAALLIQVLDRSDQAKLDRIHAAQNAWEQCFFTEAKRRYRGEDTPEIEHAIIHACRPEGQAFADAMLAMDDRAEVQAAARPQVEQSLSRTESAIAALAMAALAR